MATLVMARQRLGAFVSVYSSYNMYNANGLKMNAAAPTNVLIRISIGSLSSSSRAVAAAAAAAEIPTKIISNKYSK